MSTANLVVNLQNADLYDHPVNNFTQIETHCSYVLLTGHFAYKIKKAVDFGFLNYNDLKKRKHFCEEELARNQAMAADIYLEVVPIYGSTEHPTFIPQGEPIEYAVKMHEFSQENLLSKLQLNNKLTESMILRLAENLAKFHLQAKHVALDSPIGTAPHAQQQTIDNFTQTIPLLNNEEDIAELTQLQQQVEQLYQRIEPIITRRKQQGFVRQCHGDVHLNNIVLINDNPIIFDCIDFNNDFCWTDTIADLAFITMDLDEFEEHDLSMILLNRYLEITGDYDGLSLLPYFQSYRAMVRAKVAIFTLINAESAEIKQEQYQRYQGCVHLAKQYLQPKPRRLIITSGVSASGKSTLAKQLQQNIDVICLSSDRERKRLANIALEQDCTAPVLTGIYQDRHTTNTYKTLEKLSEAIINANYSVLVDATFRDNKHRQQFAQLAEKLHAPFIVLYCYASEIQLRNWLEQRRTANSRISEATQDVLSMQLEHFESPLESHPDNTIVINTEQSINLQDIVEDINKIQ